MKVGLVGLGSMGMPIGMRLLAAHVDLVVADIAEEREGVLVTAGASKAPSMAALAETSDVVLVCLPSIEAVKAVVLDPSNGVLQWMAQGSVLVDLSTVSIAVSREEMTRAATAGVHFVDGPVTASTGSAADGGLTMFAGGTPEAVEAIRPIAGTFCSAVHHMGPAGAGTTMKLMTQYIKYIDVLATAEALHLGASEGISPRVVLDLLPLLTRPEGNLRAFDDWARRHRSPTPLPVTATVSVVAKDLRVAVEASQEAGAPHALGVVAAEYFTEAERAGDADAQLTAVFDVVARSSTHNIADLI